METERGSGHNNVDSDYAKSKDNPNWKHQPWELKQMQILPIQAKERMSFERIRAWYETFDDVYFSYSGGKDSTVLFDMVARFCKEYGYTLHVVFVNTGLEYPEVREFAKDNTRKMSEKYGIKIDFKMLYPDMNFHQVIITYGYPIISKEVSKIVHGARHSEDKKQSYINKLKGLNPDGSYSEYKQQYKNGNCCCKHLLKYQIAAA